MKRLVWMGIGVAIAASSDDALQVDSGSLYPALHRLAKQGWIDAEWAVSELGRRAKYYRLTPAGRRWTFAQMLAPAGIKVELVPTAGDDIDLDFRSIIENRSIGGQWEVEFMGRSIRPYDEGDVMAFCFSAGGAAYCLPVTQTRAVRRAIGIIEIPGARFNVDVKHPAAVDPLARLRHRRRRAC